METTEISPNRDGRCLFAWFVGNFGVNVSTWEDWTGYDAFHLGGSVYGHWSILSWRAGVMKV
jgi:hypothetical protein